MPSSPVPVTSGPRWRFLHPLIWLALAFFSLLQRWGETTFDTKLDLVMDPAAFLGRSASFWNPLASFGEIQNQAYGYLFPQGAFFVLGDLLGLAPWIVQRAWSALLLILAYEGARRLWRAVSDDTGAIGGAAVGLAYAFAPRLLGLDGTLTGEIVPTSVLPWLLLPLVKSRRGTMSPARAGFLSAAALLCCGGLNAVENLAILPLPFVLLVAGVRENGGWRRLWWWMGPTALASLWWMLPLLVMGRYSPPFLDYIETAAATTSPLGWFNVVRGADHWVGFVSEGGVPYWPASYALSATQTGIVVTALVAGVGLIGLFHPRMPWRGVWVTSFLIGAICLVVGHASPLGSPLAPWVRDLLNGPLAPFRNVHKVDPLLRLPLALGVGTVVLLLAQQWRSVAWRRVTAIAALAGTVLLVVGSGYPMYQGDLRRPGWTEVPDAWQEAAAYVEENHGTGRVLLLPGSGFANQTWGATVDEPLQALSSVPWVTRSQIPLAPGPSIRLLDTIEERIASGIGSPELGELLARSGISMVLVRRDLNASATDAPPPNRVDMAVGRSGGITQVAGFGQTDIGGLPLIEVYEVDEDVPQVDIHDRAGTPVLAGDPGDVLGALEADTIPADGTTLFGKDAAGRPLDVQSDGYRLQQRQFGRVHDATTDIMSPDDPLRGGARVGDYAPVAGEQPAYRHHDGVAAMDASSSAGFVDVVGAPRAEAGPYSAVDGQRRTAWETASFRDPRDAWLAMELRSSRRVDTVPIYFSLGSGMARVTQVRVTSDNASDVVAVDPATGVAVARLGSLPTRNLRIEVTKVLTRGDEGVVAIEEVGIQGMWDTSRVVVPDEGADAGTSFVFEDRIPRGACTPTVGGPVCDESAIRSPDPDPSLAREFTVASVGRYDISGWVVARPSDSVALLTQPLSPREVTVESDSVFAQDPLVVPQYAYDGDFGTAWISERSKEQPVLSLKWGQKRTLRGLRVTATPNAEAPIVAIVRGGGEERTVFLDDAFSDGAFAPLRASAITIELLRPESASSDAPIGIAELRIDGLDEWRNDLANDQETGAICGLGPPVTIDGLEVPTRVSGTLGDLAVGSPLTFESCGDPFRLAAGTHTMRVGPTGQFQPVTGRLISRQPRGTSASPSRSVEVTHWAAGERDVTVGPGDEAVLRIPENSNPGWVATLDGERLEPVAPDGWQQGFVVPPGEGGRVQVRFAGDTAYHLALGLGLIGALVVLVGAAFLTWRERRGSGRSDPKRVPGRRSSIERSSRSRSWAVRCAVAVLGGLLGGVPVLVGVLAAGLVRGWRLVLLTAVMFLAALAAATLGSGWMVEWGADALAGTGIGLLVGSLVIPGRGGNDHA